jgi:hypothetical protein
MNRREAIQKVSWILGGTIIGSSIIIREIFNRKRENDIYDDTKRSSQICISL